MSHAEGPALGGDAVSAVERQQKEDAEAAAQWKAPDYQAYVSKLWTKYASEDPSGLFGTSDDEMVTQKEAEELFSHLQSVAFGLPVQDQIALFQGARDFVAVQDTLEAPVGGPGWAGNYVKYDADGKISDNQSDIGIAPETKQSFLDNLDTQIAALNEKVMTLETSSVDGQAPASEGQAPSLDVQAPASEGQTLPLDGQSSPAATQGPEVAVVSGAPQGDLGQQGTLKKTFSAYSTAKYDLTSDVSHIQLLTRFAQHGGFEALGMEKVSEVDNLYGPKTSAGVISLGFKALGPSETGQVYAKQANDIAAKMDTDKVFELAVLTGLYEHATHEDPTEQAYAEEFLKWQGADLTNGLTAALNAYVSEKGYDPAQFTQKVPASVPAADATTDVNPDAQVAPDVETQPEAKPEQEPEAAPVVTVAPRVPRQQFARDAQAAQEAEEAAKKPVDPDFLNGEPVFIEMKVDIGTGTPGVLWTAASLENSRNQNLKDAVAYFDGLKERLQDLKDEGKAETPEYVKLQGRILDIEQSGTVHFEPAEGTKLVEWTKDINTTQNNYDSDQDWRVGLIAGTGFGTGYADYEPTIDELKAAGTLEEAKLGRLVVDDDGNLFQTKLYTNAPFHSDKGRVEGAGWIRAQLDDKFTDAHMDYVKSIPLDMDSHYLGYVANAVEAFGQNSDTHFDAKMGAVIEISEDRYIHVYQGQDGKIQGTFIGDAEHLDEIGPDGKHSYGAIKDHTPAVIRDLDRDWGDMDRPRDAKELADDYVDDYADELRDQSRAHDQMMRP